MPPGSTRSAASAAAPGRSGTGGRQHDDPQDDRARADSERGGHERASRAVRVWSDPVHGIGRCALRAASPVRQRRRCARRRRARALRGRGPLGAGRPVTALGAHGEDVRAPESQACLLPVHGVPDRPLAGQQRHEPAARPRGAARRRGERPRLAGRARAGARRRPGQRRAGTPGRVLRRVDGHDATAGHGLRAALRIRHLQADHPRTAGSASSRTTGCATRTHGKSPDRPRRSRSR